MTAQQVLQLLIRQYERGAKGKNSIVRVNGRLVRIRRLHTCGRLTVAYCCGASEEQARQMKVEREMIDMSVSDILHKPDRVALAAELGFVAGERETSYRWQKFRQAVGWPWKQRRADAGANDEGSSQEQPGPADQAMGAEGDDEDVSMDDDDEEEEEEEQQQQQQQQQQEEAEEEDDDEEPVAKKQRRRRGALQQQVGPSGSARVRTLRRVQQGAAGVHRQDL